VAPGICKNGHDLRDGALFCPACGTAVPERCPSGHELRAGSLFCSTCGAAIGTAGTTSAGQVTQRQASRVTRAIRSHKVLSGLASIVLLAAIVVPVVALSSHSAPTSASGTTSSAGSSGAPSFDKLEQPNSGSGDYDSISCPDSTFCAVVGIGAAVTFNGDSWSTPMTIATSSMLYPVSCASAEFCAAAAGGNVFTFDGSSWKQTANLNMDVQGLSCSGLTFCVAVGGNDEASFNGTKWTTPSVIDNAPQMANEAGLVAVSCPTSRFCAAVDESENVFDFAGGSWSGPRTIPTDGATGGDGNTISCASSTLCVSGTANGSVSVFDGTAWSLPTVIDVRSGNQHAPPSVSCPALNFCAATDFGGDVMFFNGRSWSSPRELSSSASDVTVSCASEAFCGALMYAKGVFVGRL
jgi:hypothetical protein